MSEVGSWKSEVGSRKSEVGGRKSEVGSRKSEVGSRKLEVGRPFLALLPFAHCRANNFSEFNVLEPLQFPIHIHHFLVKVPFICFLTFVSTLSF